jgi:hypothetical protein
VTWLDRLTGRIRRAAVALEAAEAEQQAKAAQLSGIMVMRHESRERQRDIAAGHLIVRGPQP